MRALVLFLGLALALSVPAVPQAEHQIADYTSTHGHALIEHFVRAKLSTKRAMSEEAVQHTTANIFKKVAAQSHAEKIRYLSGMHDKISRFEQHGGAM